MFETAVPCVVFGVIAGMIIGELLLRVWVPTKHINLLKP
jgi:ABC-type phosphate transport system permease subunit